MNFLCERIGFFLKQGSSAHDIKIHYFFIDDDFNIFYCRNYAFMERLFRESDSIPELINQMDRKQIKKIKFNNSKISSLKTFPSLEYIPFPNRNCFELTISLKKYKSILIFAIFDDNINLLYDFMKNYSAYLKKLFKNMVSEPELSKKEENQFMSKGSNNFKRLSPSKIITSQDSAQEISDYNEKFKIFITLAEEIQKKKLNLEKSLSKEESVLKDEINKEFLSKKEETNKNEEEKNMEDTLQNKEDQLQNEDINNNELLKSDDLLKSEEIKIVADEENVDDIQILTLDNGNTYSGQVLNGKPHGQGTEFREDGLSYKGEFRKGKWHGAGYLVDSNLDLCFAEFIDGEPVGF